MYILTLYSLHDDYGMDVMYQAASESEAVLHEAAVRWADERGIWEITDPANLVDEFRLLKQLFDGSEEPDNPRMLIRPVDSLVFTQRADDDT